MRKIVKLFNTKATSIDEAAKTITFAISTDQEDRDGEVVDQKSWNFKNYQSNPQFLWGHDPSQPENVLGKCLDVSVADDGSETLGTFHFDTDINPKAALVFEQLKRGSLRTVSCGFISGATEYIKGIPHLLKNELLEVSVVPIPSNAGAMAKDLKSGVLSTKDAKWLVESMQRETELIEKQIENQSNEEEHSSMEIKALTTQVSALLDGITSLTKAQADTNDRLDKIAEKGAVAEIAAVEDRWDLEDVKWDQMGPVCTLFYALQEAYFYSGTPVEQFEPLVKEFVQLVGAVLDGSYDKSATGLLSDALTNPLDDVKVKAMIATLLGGREQAKSTTAEADHTKDVDVTDTKDANAEDELKTDPAQTEDTVTTTDQKGHAEHTEDTTTTGKQDKSDESTDDSAKGGDNDQPGAEDGKSKEFDLDTLDLDAELTPELKEQIDTALK